MQQERSKLLKKFSHAQIVLNEKQHDEMCNIMENVLSTGSHELKSILEEGNKQGVGPAIQAI